MTDIKQRARRYLLGELSEPEQLALEEGYFSDPQVFAELTAEEHALIDEYVRGRLEPGLRQRFEFAYMSRPERRARVEFAEALLRRTDASSSFDSHAPGASWFTGWLSPRPWLVAAAVATAIVIAAATWIVLQSTRRGPESQQTQTTNVSPSAPPESAPGQPDAPKLSFVTLSLRVGAGQRTSGLDAMTTLEIPAGTETVRMALTLRERDYGRYRVLVRAVGGEEILQRGDLRPSLEPSGPAFTIDAPATSFTSGDYVLTLQGATDTGEFDDLSQSLFRVRQVR